MVEVYVPRASDWIGAFEAGQQGAMTRRKDQTARQIGGLMASGDYKGASAAAYGGGDYAVGAQIEGLGAKRQSETRRAGYGELLAGGQGKEAVSEAYRSGDFEIGGELQKAIDSVSENEKKLIRDKAERIATIVAPLGEIPETDMASRRAYIQQHTPDLIAAGYTQDQLAGFEPTNANLAPIYAEALGLKDYLGRQETMSKPDWREQKNADGSTTWVDFNARNGGAQPQAQPGAQMAGGGSSDADAVWRAAIQQESGGRPGVRGPQTDYGVAEGLTQMLPATAQEMAQKLGVQWRPELMTGTTPEAAQYQERLGRAYFDQGLQKYGGDVRKALAYYHGGPDESIWGPKTRAHVEAVMRRVPQGQASPRMTAAAPQPASEAVLAGGPVNDEVQPYQVASMGETPAPPSGGLRTRQGSAAPRPEWQDLPGGGQINIRTGEKKNMPGVDSGPALDPATGLTPVGDPRQGVYRNAVGQKFQTNRAGTVQRLAGPTDAQVGEAEKRIKAINETMALVDAVDEQLGKTSTLGPGGRYIVNQAEFARLDSLTKQLQIAYKNAAELGAITGPDVPFIEAVAPNPRELRSLIQRGEFAPRLQSLAKVAGTKYRGETAAFKSLGGDAKGLTPLFRSPRSNVPYDNEGRMTVPKADKAALIREAQAAIAKGAPRAAVIQELRKMGVEGGI